MQANSAAIPYMQTPMPQQTDYRGEAGKSQKDDSFSKALDREMSQGKAAAEKPDQKQTATDKPAAEKPADSPVSDAAPADSQTAIVIPLFIQNPILQPAELQQIQLQQTAPVAAVDAADVQSAVLTQTEEPAVLLQTAGAEKPAENRTDFRQMANLAEAAPETAQQPQQTENAELKAAVSTEEPEAAAGKAETAVIRPVEEGEENQIRTETGNMTAADMSKAVRQDMAGRQAAFEAPQTVQRQTVDMTDPNAGIQKLSQTMTENLTKGLTEFEIWLEPANLGKMAIKVAYESGRAMVSIMCTNEKAMELISQNARNLGSILEQHTGNNTVVVVEQPEADYLQQQAEQENGKGYQNQEENSGNQDDSEGDAQSFLEQLRLGLK